MSVRPAVQAYDDAFRIVQEAMMRQESMAAVQFLTRVEFYLMERGAEELTADLRG